MVVRRPGQIAAVVVCVLLASPLAGCVSVAEYRKLERDVRSMKTRDGGGSSGREQVADLAARMDSLETELRRLRGQVEVSDHNAASALDEARKARRDAGGAVVGSVPGTEDAGARAARRPASLRPSARLRPTLEPLLTGCYCGRHGWRRRGPAKLSLWREFGPRPGGRRRSDRLSLGVRCMAAQRSDAH